MTRKILGLGLVAMVYDNSRASPGEQLDNVLLELTGLETDLELLGQEAESGEILDIVLKCPYVSPQESGCCYEDYDCAVLDRSE